MAISPVFFDQKQGVAKRAFLCLCQRALTCFWQKKVCLCQNGTCLLLRHAVFDVGDKGYINSSGVLRMKNGGRFIAAYLFGYMNPV